MLWREVQRRLEEAGVGPAPREGMALLGYVLGCDTAALVLREGADVLQEDRERLENLVLRRLGGEPLGYVLGGVWVAGRWWKVQEGVLIPRPDTEVLIEEAKKRLSAGMTVAEIGVGSGVILGTLGAEVAGLGLIGTDVSEVALSVAAENMDALGVRADVRLAGFLDEVEGPLDMVVSNPPYIGEEEWRGLEPCVRDWEPREALVGGVRGDEIYGEIVRAAAARMGSGGWLGVEMGWRQAEAVVSFLKTEDWTDVCVVQDLAGRDRNIWARRV